MRQLQSRQVSSDLVPLWNTPSNSFFLQLKLPSRSLENTSNLDEQQHLVNEALHGASVPNPATPLRGQVGTVQTIQLRPSPAAGTAVGTAGVGATNNGTASKLPSGAALRTTATKSPNVMPLLNSSEICRQLHELRRHNEELRRRVELVQKEKEDMLQRIERLEQLMLVRESDAEMEYVDI